jgi:hypothetical protein
MGTDLGVRCTLSDIGRSRQLCKNECGLAERTIAFWRQKAISLLRHRKATRGRAVAEDIGNAFQVLARALGKRDDCRAKLRNLHERQGQLRKVLDELKNTEKPR